MKADKKGFTVAECVVAMAVVVIVSVAGYSTLSKALSRAQTSFLYDEIILCADNAIECFKANSDIESFARDFNKLIPSDAATPTPVPTTEPTPEPTEVSKSHVYVLENAEYSMIISVSYKANEEMMTISVTDSNYKNVFSTTYRKGAN